MRISSHQFSPLNSHENLWVSWLEYISTWEAIFVKFRVHILKVKVLSQICGKHFHVALGESLSEASPAPAKEGQETVWVSRLTIWSQGKRILWVPSFRQELVRSLPLLFIPMQTNYGKSDDITLSEVVLPCLEVT